MTNLEKVRNAVIAAVPDAMELQLVDIFRWLCTLGLDWKLYPGGRSVMLMIEGLGAPIGIDLIKPLHLQSQETIDFLASLLN